MTSAYGRCTCCGKVEEWKAAYGVEHSFEVSNFGRDIWAKRTWKWIHI